jgi:proteic killer suppression protein
VIVSFGDPDTAALYHGNRARKGRRFPPDIVAAALRKLDYLEAAKDLRDLRAPPGNHLEALRGDLAGCHSIRVNDRWRVVFRWTPQGAEDVSLRD